MNKLTHWIIAILFATCVGGFSTAIIVPQTAQAVCMQQTIIGPSWYNGLVDGNCNIIGPTGSGGMSAFIWKIVLNVVTMLLYIVGYVAVFYIILGGFTYLTSTGLADKITSAKKTITNAIIGLVISIFSIAIVNVIAGAI